MVVLRQDCKVKKFKISTRLYLLVGFALLAMACSTLFVLVQTKTELESNRRNMLTVLGGTATGIIDSYYKQEQAGTLTRQEAQARAITAVRAMLYEPNGYFWINDMQETMVMRTASRFLPRWWQSSKSRKRALLTITGQSPVPRTRH
jgi:signal transduction histidine kinase